MLYNRVKGSLNNMFIVQCEKLSTKKMKKRKEKVTIFKKKENQNSKGMNILALPRFSQYKDFNLTKKVQFHNHV